jgi:hypothetical protein
VLGDRLREHLRQVRHALRPRTTIRAQGAERNDWT